MPRIRVERLEVTVSGVEAATVGEALEALPGALAAELRPPAAREGGAERGPLRVGAAVEAGSLARSLAARVAAEIGARRGGAAGGG